MDKRICVATYPRSDRKRKSAFAISSSLRSSSCVLLSLAFQISAKASPLVAPRHSLKSILEDCTRVIAWTGHRKSSLTHVLLTQLIINDNSWYFPLCRTRDQSRIAKILEFVLSPVRLVFKVVGCILAGFHVVSRKSRL